MTSSFRDKSFRFLRALACNNERAWFQAHKADYEAHVRAPFLRLLLDLQPALAEVSEHYRADPKPYDNFSVANAKQATKLAALDPVLQATSAEKASISPSRVRT